MKSRVNRQRHKKEKRVSQKAKNPFKADWGPPIEHPLGLYDDNPDGPIDLSVYEEDVELPEEILPFEGM